MLPVSPQHTGFGKEVDSNPNSIIKASLLLHLQWLRHPCQHKAWTLHLGFVDRKIFPVLQQLIPKVGKYYNPRDKVIKSSREGTDGWKERHLRRHLIVTWMNIYLSHTCRQWWSWIHHRVKAALVLGWSSTTGASATPSKAQGTCTSDCVWAQNLWELWFRTLHRAF